MYEFRPTIGIEFDDKYINAKNKLIDFVGTWSDLTDAQKYQLTKEFMVSFGMAASFEQFVSYMNNGGRK